MLKLALVLFLVSIVAGVLGFPRVSAGTAMAARFIFFLVVAVFLVILVFGVILGTLVF